MRARAAVGASLVRGPGGFTVNTRRDVFRRSSSVHELQLARVHRGVGIEDGDGAHRMAPSSRQTLTQHPRPAHKHVRLLPEKIDIVRLHRW